MKNNEGQPRELGSYYSSIRATETSAGAGATSL